VVTGASVVTGAVVVQLWCGVLETGSVVVTAAVAVVVSAGGVPLQAERSIKEVISMEKTSRKREKRFIIQFLSKYEN